MSEEKDNETHFKSIEVVAEVVKEELESTPKVSAEKLRKAQLLDDLNEESSVTRELPKRNKPTAQIPDKAELGKKFTVKLGKVYDRVNLKVFQGETERQAGGGNTNIVHDKEEKRKDEISYDFFDPYPLKGITKNSLKKGKYLVRVYAHGHEAGDELEQEKIVNVE